MRKLFDFFIATNGHPRPQRTARQTCHEHYTHVLAALLAAYDVDLWIMTNLSSPLARAPIFNVAADELTNPSGLFASGLFASGLLVSSLLASDLLARAATFNVASDAFCSPNMHVGFFPSESGCPRPKGPLGKPAMSTTHTGTRPLCRRRWQK